MKTRKPGTDAFAYPPKRHSRVFVKAPLFLGSSSATAYSAAERPFPCPLRDNAYARRALLLLSEDGWYQADGLEPSLQLTCKTRTPRVEL